MESANFDGDPLNPIYGPLSCSDETTKLLDLRGLSTENPSILIQKERLLQDINERLEDSDFFIYKDCIESYPSDTLLLVLDEHEKHGEEYYICLTKEGKEKVLSELSSKTEQEVEVLQEEKEYKNAELGLVSTEDEIEDERVDENNQKIQIMLLPNKDVSRRPLELFSKMPSDHGELYLEILPESQYYDEEEEDEKKDTLEPIFRKTMDCGFQVSVQYDDNCSQTKRCKLCNACTQTQLKLFTEEEKDDLWKSNEMETFLPTAEERILDVLIENSCGGLEKPWATLKSKESEIESGKDVPLTVSKSFICVGEKESKMITSIDWHPLFKDVFVAATAQNITFEEKTDNLSELLLEPCLNYIWSFEDQLLPRLLLDGCDEILSVKFNPTMPHIVVGGGVNGQLILWDLSEDEEKLQAPLEYDWVRHATPYNESALGDDASTFKSTVSRYCASTSIDHSHSLGAYYVEWVPAGIEILPKGEVKSVDSNKSYQIVSCGFDGNLRFWDLRFKIESPGVEMDSESYSHSPYESLDMIWRPFHVVDITPPEGQKRLSLSTFSLKLSHLRSIEDKADQSKSNSDAITSISTVFFAGTEDGKVLQADFNIKTSTGKHLAPAQPVFYTSVQGVHMHGGAVVKLAHSPFLSNVFISLGDKTAALWREDFRKGPLFVDISKSTITSGHWSPTRPAVFTLGLHNGSLRIWDILRSSRSPQLVQAVASAAITTITTRWVSEDKQVLAVGDGDGFVHILELPKYLWKPMEQELSYVEQFLTREAKRVEVQNKKQIVVDMKKKAAEAKALEAERRQKEKTVEVVKEEKVEKSPAEKLKELLSDEYQEFLHLEQNLLVELGYLVLDEKGIDEEDNS